MDAPTADTKAFGLRSEGVIVLVKLVGILIVPVFAHASMQLQVPISASRSLNQAALYPA